MTYRLRLDVVSVDAAIRALDLLRRLSVEMLELETAKRNDGFLVHLSYEAESEQAARHITVRIGQIVGVTAAEMLLAAADEVDPSHVKACAHTARSAPSLTSPY
ncbi:hypothetical protein J5J86_05450 [Aquabacter sp. L1I39]|uniref:hypothetical protein n=1 Tax=Aquabacter sp. L1I39 TaxID=2820278 RepID=UPI001ADC9AF2|nr:hypothetical protein [Aquabacter sp. L1I39]QTL04771.1 hypothetical protein J5J86_05450 [Aquabacter sp. L1I39]